MNPDKKPFFFRVEPAELMNFATDPEGEGMTLLQFAKELQRGSSEINFIQGLIDETEAFIEKKRNSGRLGGLAKQSGAKAVLSGAKAKPSTPLASSSSSTESVTETKKKDNIIIPDFISKESWHSFLEMRKMIKKPMSDYAKKLAFKKLKRFKDEGYDVNEIIDNSTMSNYCGLFKPKEPSDKVVDIEALYKSLGRTM